MEKKYLSRFGSTLCSLLLFAILALVINFSSHAANIDEKISSLRIEQAHARMPEIQVYYYPDADKNQESPLAASLASEKLQIESLESYSEETGMDYYLLVDISASISKKYFASIQDALLKFHAGMKKNDRLTLITFGDEVNLIFENKTVKDDVQEAIMALENKDMTTALFQAIEKTARMADTDGNAMKRSIVFVITDGEDFAVNKSSANEASATMEKAGLPLYSMAVEKMAGEKENQYINEFGEFTRSTGGQLSVFNDENTWECMQQIVHSLYNAKLLKLEASNNKSYQTLQTLTITFPDEVSAAVNVLASRSVPDEIPPTVKARQESDKSISMTFSKKVLNAEIPDNYKVTVDGDTILTVHTVEVSDSNPDEVILIFQDPFYNGEYEITCKNIYDDSKEANLVTWVSRIKVEDGLKEDSGIIKFLKDFWFVFVALFTVLSVGLTLLLVYLRVKKNKGVVVVDGKVTLQSNMEVKQRVDIEKETGHKLIVQLRDGKNSIKEIPILVSGSVIVGRSSICNLYFNDNNLSKQHFAIEEGADGFYILDLNTTNGTMVNGIKIHQKRKLQQGDLINAGMLEMTLRW